SGIVLADGRLSLGTGLWGGFYQGQPVFGYAKRLAGLQHNLLDRPVLHVDMITAAQVLEQPAALVRALELSVAARDAWVRQVNVAGRLAANQKARPVQRNLPAA